MEKPIKRSANFSGEEVESLIEMATQQKTIIENKRTDRVTTERKEAAWETIAAEFNAVFSHTFRSGKALRKKYENLKRDLKRKNPS